jgi:hypothetical protein
MLMFIRRYSWALLAIAVLIGPVSKRAAFEKPRAEEPAAASHRSCSPSWRPRSDSRGLPAAYVGRSPNAVPAEPLSRGRAGSWRRRKKSIPIRAIHDITKGTFNLSTQMGELLKGKVEFTRLWDIRRAYSLAFHPRSVRRNVVDSVDAALADKSLDEFAAVRNVIVHKASVADEDYDDDRKKLPTLPQAGADKRIVLDGERVRSLIEPAVGCCLKLLTTIDSWLHSEKATI